MIGIRQLHRNLKNLWINRGALAATMQILLNDKVDIATLKITRKLNARGHSTAAKIRRPVDGNNDPIPWYTYPLIDFISDWNTKSWNIIEFGSGQSTLYWSSRVSQVIAFESSKEWFAELRNKIPENVDLKFFENLKSLCALKDVKFLPDLVIVDGWKRQACAEAALKAFGDAPIYLLDNSDWFLQTAKIFRAAGLTEIRFKGFGPINGYAWASSLFVNSNNLEKLNSISFDSEVPGGLPPGDTERCDLNA